MAGADLKDIFFIECDDLLVAMEEGLRELEGGSTDANTINAVFRAVHSIKGGAGAFALTELVGFAHRFETVLDNLRSARLETSAALFGALLAAGDHLSDMVNAARTGAAPDPDVTDQALQALAAAAGMGDDADEAAGPGDAAIAASFVPMAFDFDLALDLAGPAARTITIAFKPDDTAADSGHDAAMLLRQLADLGEIRVTANLDDLPEPDQFDPQRSYIGWTVEMETDLPLAEIEVVFEFARDACQIEITESGPPAAAGAPLPGLPELPPLGDAAPGPAPEPAAPAAAAEVEAEAGAGTEGTAAPAPAEPAKPGPGKPAPQPAVSTAAAPRQTIRVDIGRVDRLVDVVGELVIHQAMLNEAIEQSGLKIVTEVERGLDQLRQLSRQIQESVMAIRAQPVKPLFDRMHRIVREASGAAGKSARLVTEGEMTEVDKTIIERLADPLTHMIRNSVDHGIERAETREAAGKPAEGTVTLSAAHRSGRIMITLSDDGGGIDRERVRQVAIDKGLIPASADLAPAEIDNLLFLPGFSTASEVSNLSGRGVGMDVVRSEITGLGGRVAIASAAGEGTTMTISLPLTLAVLDGMVVEVAGQLLVLPVSTIIETLRPDASTQHSIGTEDTVLDVRGAFVPVIDVGTALGFRSGHRPDRGGIVVLVERGNEGILALMVDGIRDQRQVVIKGLEENYGHIPGIAAATVLGDGSVALILDPADIARPTPSPRSAAPLAAE